MEMQMREDALHIARIQFKDRQVGNPIDLVDCSQNTNKRA